MDQKNAVKLLDNTFNQDFDLDRFSIFIKELFNHFNLRINEDIPLRKEYYGYIKQMDSLGVYSDSNGDSIEVFTVQLETTSSRDRARTMQRNLIAKYLKNSGSNAALVAFYGDDPQDWRFSFVKIEYDLVKDEKGNLKVQEDITPAKRYSFLVGKNEPNHTCRRQFLHLIKEENTDPLVEQVEEAFSIEKVTKEFFEEYQKLFLKLLESLEHVITNNDIVRNEFEKKSVPTTDFAKKLMGQIVFIYFLQKKGWLGVEKDEKWGKGPRNFLRKLFNKEMVDYDNFFNDILEPLFYEALATPRDDDYYRHFDCKIPFLNGGLFEPINEYDWVTTEITLKNKIFEDILDVFDLYNFTIKEDEPLEKEVAVDPEMLGKVFENLLDVKDRKSQGAFYTPREIVHYMCQESLINYLNTNSDISRDDLENFIHLGDFALDMLIREIIEFGELKEDREYGLPKSIKENHRRLDDLLKIIKVVDPAVGSGAFPVGMMNEIVKARAILSFLSGEEKSNYQLKLETIRDCLYGVDIDSSAVDIAKLRFWLSLIVDEEDIDKIDPLPNLDHKIMCGNSLLEEFEGNKLFDEKLLGEITPDDFEEIENVNQKIEALYKELGKIHTGKTKNKSFKIEIEKELKKLDRKKKKLLSKTKDLTQQFTLDDDYYKRKIKESQLKLKELKKLQGLYFKEQNTKLKKKYRAEIEEIEWEFIEENLLEQCNEKSLEKLRQYKKNKSKPFFLWKLYYAEIFRDQNPGFDVVIANPPYVSAVTHVKKNSEERSRYRELYPELSGAFDLYAVFLLKGLELINKKGSFAWIIPNKFMVSDYSKKVLKKMSQKGLYATIDVSRYNVFHDVGIYPIILLGNSVSENYNNYEITELDDLEKNNLQVLEELFEFKTFKDFGIKVGSGTTGFQASQIKPLIVNETEKTKKAIPFAVSGSIDPYTLNTEKVRYMKGHYSHPYIRYDKNIIAERKWNFWKNEKIIVAGMTKRIEAHYVKTPLALGVGCYAIFDYAGFDPHFLLGLLNSKFLSYYLNYKFKDKHLAGGYLAINKSTIESLPLVEVTEEKQTPIIKLVLKILEIQNELLDLKTKKEKIKDIETKIDNLVYELFDLSQEEINIVKEGVVK